MTDNKNKLKNTTAAEKGLSNDSKKNKEAAAHPGQKNSAIAWLSLLLAVMAIGLSAGIFITQKQQVSEKQALADKNASLIKKKINGLTHQLKTLQQTVSTDTPKDLSLIHI